MAIPAIISLAKRLDVSKNDNGISKNGVYEPFSYRFSKVFIDKKIDAVTVLNKLKSRGFRATSLPTYDFYTLYTTLPHNLIKEKLKKLN